MNEYIIVTTVFYRFLSCTHQLYFLKRSSILEISAPIKVSTYTFNTHITSVTECKLRPIKNVTHVVTT